MTKLMIYGVVGDEADGLTAAALVPQISAARGDVSVRINSPGGFIVEGLAIFTALDRVRSSGRKVIIHIDGVAASIASTIAMAGTEILMAENALLMVHNPWDSTTGDARALRKQADLLDKVRDQMVAIYAAQTGIEVGDLALMLATETWLNADEALASKFITSIVPAMKMAACDVTAFGFRQAPKNPLIATAAAAMTDKPEAAAADLHPQETEDMSEQDLKPAADKKPAADTVSIADVQARIDTAVAAETARISTIRSLTKKHGLDDAFADKLVTDKATVETARASILDRLADEGDAANIGHNSPARVTTDQRDKFREGATNWLLVKAGVAPMIEAAAKMKGETVKIDPGEFRGVRNVDLAREALDMAGVRGMSRDPDAIVRDAMIGARGYQTTSDFPVLFETALHKTLQAAYATTPDTWSRFCGTGTVTDFRAANRYLKGTFGALDTVNEHGEFKNKPIPDLAREAIRATTKGNIIALTRQAIVNDNEMDVFSGLATDLGRAAKLTIEIDVYALINSNPAMNDGNQLFSTAHGNLAGTGAAPAVTVFDAIRVAMAQQKDLSGNEFLDVRPSIILAPIGLGGAIRRLNAAAYDPDQTGKFQIPNIVNGLFNEVVDTPRLAGTAYYVFADPQIAPTIEVVFLNGVTEPYTETMNGWRIDGTEWKVRHDYGVGAINWRSGYKQPGA